MVAHGSAPQAAASRPPQTARPPRGLLRRLRADRPAASGGSASQRKGRRFQSPAAGRSASLICMRPAHLDSRGPRRTPAHLICILPSPASRPPRIGLPRPLIYISLWAPRVFLPGGGGTRLPPDLRPLGRPPGTAAGRCGLENPAAGRPGPDVTRKAQSCA